MKFIAITSPLDTILSQASEAAAMADIDRYVATMKPCAAGSTVSRHAAALEPQISGSPILVDFTLFLRLYRR